MKYWNKRKKSRTDWTRVSIGPSPQPTDKLKLWCQQNESSGRFYFYPNWHALGYQTYTSWVFEFSEDATAFKLIYG